jgi:hypothetical protein
MAMNWPKAGPNDVSAYLLPGIPWVTGTNVPAAPSVMHISFPAVTKFLFLRNTSPAASAVRVGFSENGVSGNPASESHYFILSQSTERSLEIRVKDLFLLTAVGAPSVEIIAGLTHIMYPDFPVMTGSNAEIGRVPIFSGIG